MKKIVHYEQRTCDQCGKQERYDLEPKRYGIFAPFPGWIEVTERAVSVGIGRTHVSKDYCSVKCHVDAVTSDVA